MSTVPTATLGTTVMVEVDGPDQVETVDRWCRRTGNSVLAVHEHAVEVFRGRLDDPAATLPADRMPGRRLWFYTNFHCNLACDYCCVSSSPRADPRLLDLGAVTGAVAEAATAGVDQLYLTGGEPFLHPQLPALTTVCAEAAPTVVLTNAMLFRGPGLRALQNMPRENLKLQVSIDSPTADRHDAHRGHGSWQRAVDGVRTARNLGFDVRLAITLADGATHDEAAVDSLCLSLDVDTDIVVRRVARQGVATRGIGISKATVVPEVTVTADGVYWHPVAATDPAMRVSAQIAPLTPVIESIKAQFRDHRRRGEALAATFPCA